MAQTQREADALVETSQSPPPILPAAQFFHEPKSPLGRASAEVSPIRSYSLPVVPHVARPDPMPIAKSYNAGQEKKMHQTSTRIMRTNPDGRPFAKDFHDLFSTLIVSLNIRTHRSRFRTFPYSFTTEEAVSNLANLKFAQSNRMPDPNDQNRVVTTTTTTTFSMAKDMARALCQRFIDARFFESAADKGLDTFKDRGIWTLTPKGVCTLSRFMMRNGIVSEHIGGLVSKHNTLQLMVLERDSDTDEILQDKSVIEIVFRRFVGRTPNVKASTSISDSDSVSDYSDGTTGVKLAETRRFGEQTIPFSFIGRTAISWLTDCTTVLDFDEAHDLAEMFVSQNLIDYIGDVKGKSPDQNYAFQSAKSSIYVITAKGRRVAGWDPVASPADLGGKQSSGSSGTAKRNSLHSTSSSGAIPKSSGSSKDSTTRSPDLPDAAPVTAAAPAAPTTTAKETNTNRLNLILADPGLRSQFREFLCENYCEENLSFYLDVVEFVRQIRNVQALDGVSEGLARAYSIYNAYLAAGSPCELNLDHQLRLEMTAQMSKAVDGDETSMYTSLAKVAELYDRAQKQVFRLMAGDSVPKFLRTPLYLELMGDYGTDEEGR